MTTEDENNQETAATDAEATEAAAEPTGADAAAAEAADAAPEASDADPGEDAAEQSTEDTEPVGEEYDPSVAGAAAHLIGVSRPQDEYGTREIDRDAMSDDELLAMGVEPDEGPGPMLVSVFVALTFILIFTGVAVAALFGWVADGKGDAISDRVHPTLAESTTEAAAVLNAYEQVPGEEGAADSYRVPIDVAMDLLVDNPTLLGRHPLGARTLAIDPPDVPAPPRAVVAPTSINAHGAAGQAVPPSAAPGTVVVQPQGAPGNTLPTPTNVAPANPHDHGGDGHAPHAGHDH